jgi:hypothetical protein
MKIELRMYGMTIYQFGGSIHSGIQFQHAVTRYGRMVEKNKRLANHKKLYDLWADKFETSIILNGGTTNMDPDNPGTLNIHLNTLVSNGVLVQDFYEPDLGNQLTAICFLVDDRVWNLNKYPTMASIKNLTDDEYHTISFLREFLPTFSLAR